ncbi:2OG-Fe(II) oxygenase [Novosphingobium sp.]|uniref:prolyl hydroxylase family protein n=1 Tax=Novosphingobium sp. TaxID=1874826 RepID=UPI0025D0E73E|nr:2OG-Fe(II) oxygenase [Novosphingobium sp.]MCC6924740.1 2OG-Fe(II) oxygenase [Novosphingobium sp.]
MTSPYADAPNPDKVALLRTGAHVRRRLDGDPRAQRIETDRAEIWGVPDFLTAEECDALIAMIDRTAVPSKVLDHGTNEIWRTSSSGDVDRYDPFVHTLESRIDEMLGIPHPWGETMQGQRYQVGQEFKYHLDLFWTKSDYWKEETRRGGQRAITAMCYLNDVEEGGATAFTNIGIAVAPQRGTLLVWNNSLPDGRPNEDTMHAGTPVVKGTKYVITKWYRTRKWG